MITLAHKYKALKSNASAKKLASREYAEWLVDICLDGFAVLKDEAEAINLISNVQGKQYFAYRKTTISGNQETVRMSRPINKGLYIQDEATLTGMLENFRQATYDYLTPKQITSLIYTMAMSFCATNDIRKSGDKKTPATFFELLISHIVSRQFGALPRKKVRVPSAETQNAELPTDIVFDLGPGQVKLHVPVKLSTRERVIQAWAHQRVLAGLWGESEFKGLLMVLAETKLALKTLKVTEICLPLQWAVYQRYIARLDRVYYLDVPAKYSTMATGFPRIDVKSFGEFFKEKEALLVR